MKKDFESRFMPNVKFLLPKSAEFGFWINFLAITKLHSIDNYIGFCTNAFGDSIYNGFEHIELFNNYKSVHKEVSIFEAIPELIPDGMRYNKELDKLVPDIMQWKKEDNGGNHIAVDGTSFDTLEEALNHNCTLIATSSADEYCSGIKVEFEKVLEYSEEILQRENGFIKADKEKINFSLVDPYAYEDLGKCLTIGAKKYSPDNWKIGDIESYIAALDRHLIDIKKAVLDKDKSLFIDKDNTLQHGANLLCNAMFIHYFIRKELEEK